VMMGFGLLGLVLMILFWVGLVLVAAWLVRAFFPGQGRPEPPTAPPGPSPREILDRRYARGELTRQQYELMKDDLRG